MTEKSYILFMKEVKGDRDKDSKVTYKLPKRKKMGEVKDVFQVLIFRATRDTYTYYTNVHTHSNVETIKIQESFTSSTT